MKIGLRAGGAVAAMSLMLLGACGGDDDDDGSATGTDETTAPLEDTTTTTLSPEQEVEAAYREAAAALDEALDPPNPDHTELLEHFAGDTLTRFQAFIRTNQAEGFAYVGSLEVNPTNVTVVGDTATLDDCFVDRSQIVDVETREPVSDEGETIGQRRVEMERIDGVWKVVLMEDVGTCTPG